MIRRAHESPSSSAPRRRRARRRRSHHGAHAPADLRRGRRHRPSSPAPDGGVPAGHRPGAMRTSHGAARSEPATAPAGPRPSSIDRADGRRRSPSIRRADASTMQRVRDVRMRRSVAADTSRTPSNERFPFRRVRRAPVRRVRECARLPPEGMAPSRRAETTAIRTGAEGLGGNAGVIQAFRYE